MTEHDLHATGMRPAGYGALRGRMTVQNDTVWMFLHVDDRARPEDPGGAAAFADLVLGVPPGRVVGVTDVQPSVVHAEDVNVEGHADRTVRNSFASAC